MSKPVILCADDEKIVLDSLKEQLKRRFKNDYTIETAEGGAEAFEIFEELLEDDYEIPLIVADYIMPDMKGDELLERIHALDPRTRKIMLTGQACLEGITNAINNADLYRYIAKPWDQDDLMLTATEAIRSYFQDKQILDQHEKIRKSEEKYRNIFESAVEGIFQSTPKGRFISVNPAFARIMGYDSPDELIGSITKIKEQLYVNPEKRDKLFRLLQENSVVSNYEIWQYRKDGTRIWVSLNARAVRDEKNEILFMEGFLEDITRRKADEAALLRAYEKRKELEQIINRSPVIVFLWRNDPGWSVEYVSENVSQFGYTADDFTSGRAIYSGIIHPDDLERVGKEVMAYTQEGRDEFTQDYRIFTKSGKVRWTDDHTWIRRDANGNVTHYQGIVMDVTIQKEKEEAEREREIAEAANEKIMDSIRYAKMIQSSLLPNPENVKTFLPDNFFIWMPRDIVGGDFIFTEFFTHSDDCKDSEADEKGMILAVIDCTGHGVPGAFMTMIASAGLRKIIKDEACYDPAEILNRLNQFVKTTLRQDTQFALSDDGLDAAIVRIQLPVGRVSASVTRQDEANNVGLRFANPTYKMIFAGARLPLIYLKNGELTLIKGDKQSIGYKRSDLKLNYTNHMICVEEGTRFYMFSDGFTDQLDKNRRRFGSRRLKEMLVKISPLPVEEQRKMLLEAFQAHKGDNDQQDDVTVIGFSIGVGVTQFGKPHPPAPLSKGEGGKTPYASG